MKALLSVYNKTGLLEFARRLTQAGIEIISTGGTHKAINDAGLSVQSVSDITGFPEIMDGRVKTLHPLIHGGILARRDKPEHLSQMANHLIGAIDIVVVNLYPFVQTINRPNVTLDEALENIDIGGPTLLRAAAKNFPFVTVVVDPSDYEWIGDKIGGPGLSHEDRRNLAHKAFQHVYLYDSAVSGYLARDNYSSPEKLSLEFQKLIDLRYGENPHQTAALYANAMEPGGLAHAYQIQGKELSYNNILDADAAWRVVCDFNEPTVAIIKHTNPCGLACHNDQAEAYLRAYAGDMVSAYGGIVAFNTPVTAQTALGMEKIFYEVVVAPNYTPEALEVFKKKRNLRLLQATKAPWGMEIRQVSGGALVQTSDSTPEEIGSWRTVTKRHPTKDEFEDMLFALKAAKHIKSNAIALAKGNTLIGIGAGQPNRVTSVRLALGAAGPSAAGSSLGSDAFFPFPDGVKEAAIGGVSAIAQPGGSIRDNEVIEEADRHGIAMVFTGARHFRH